MYEETTNVEIKARCREPSRVRAQLRKLKARHHGVDRQRDTYFLVTNGRLKLREGTIENSLIHYSRPTQAGPKVSSVSRFDIDQPDSRLAGLLVAAIGVQAIVDKTREIYFLDNVKIHLDSVDGLGSFLEIEAIDSSGSRTKSQLTKQCNELMRAFGVHSDDLIEGSYSDMVTSTKLSDRGFADAA